ncbi:hypothetical protein [Nocardia seriolae]|nr:hypothetical protein [Nocardia seriolae]WKY49666.1 hypothetical protein Q5P07_21515 [Nocardia seriolae]WNJ62106.1 hypothetical protein RMO66_16315 [Nocardia seriolae]BAW06575.1 threonine transporter RhtB [Nocardia seriolae]
MLILAALQLVIDTAWCVGIVLAADRAGTWLRRTGSGGPGGRRAW